MMQPLAVTMGEPAGIGPEVFVKAFLTPGIGDTLAFVWLGDPEVADAAFAAAGANAQVRVVTSDQAASIRADPQMLHVIDTGTADGSRPGHPSIGGAAAAIDAIAKAVDLVQGRSATAMVTAPVNKKALQAAGFTHPGHTEYLAALTGARHPVMMLAIDGLRVVPVTIHVPLAQVPTLLSPDLIVETGRVTAAALTRDFGIAKPRLAVAGLNPHAGEGGTMGREDIEIVAPAVKALQAAGIAASGPFPADTLFHAAARASYDAALCMYHDQALVPLKTLDFDRGVNITLGLPIVRTSPDHGTAFDIAGKGLARPDSMIAAIRMAAAMAAARAL
jgi:4-hydroxythreonine-4-phosphate dehydrogenase